MEEAKKKIYALSTTTYQGFQVECSEETSEKFTSRCSCGLFFTTTALNKEFFASVNTGCFCCS